MLTASCERYPYSACMACRIGMTLAAFGENESSSSSMDRFGFCVVSRVTIAPHSSDLSICFPQCGERTVSVMDTGRIIPTERTSLKAARGGTPAPHDPARQGRTKQRSSTAPSSAAALHQAALARRTKQRLGTAPSSALALHRAAPWHCTEYHAAIRSCTTTQSLTAMCSW